MRVIRAVWSKLRTESGYSVIELLTVMAILGVVLAGLTSVFISGSKAEVAMNRRYQAQQNARLSLGALRTDIHLAGCAATQSSGAELDLYSTPALTGSCTGTLTVVWCVKPSTDITTRYALWRVPAQNCSSTAGGKRLADLLSTASGVGVPVVFTTIAPASSGQRESVKADLFVNSNWSNTAVGDKYDLNDTIVLRNAPRQP